MPPEQNKELVLKMTEAFNTGDVSIVDQLLDPDHRIKKKISLLRKAFPDLHYTVDKMVAEDETVAFRWTMAGTHRGPLLGHPATNQTINHSGTDVVTFQDGRIVEHHAADNLGELLGKLGIRPR